MFLFQIRKIFFFILFIRVSQTFFYRFICFVCSHVNNITVYGDVPKNKSIKQYILFDLLSNTEPLHTISSFHQHYHQQQNMSIKNFPRRWNIIQNNKKILKKCMKIYSILLMFLFYFILNITEITGETFGDNQWRKKIWQIVINHFFQSFINAK